MKSVPATLVRATLTGLLLLPPVWAQAPAQTVPGELLPFNPAEWTTVENYQVLADPRASRDDDTPLKLVWASFPPTLRTDGPNSNLVTTADLHNLVYESMIGIHSETEEFVPGLASHWRIETDLANKRQTFWFRIDPKARFSDGSEVTARDVYLNWWHRVQEDRKDPSNALTFGEGYEEPEILDKYTIKVTTKKLNWRLFLYFGGMLIYKGDDINVPGSEYLEKYNWKFPRGSGPYVMKPGDLKKGESLALTRRWDWWGENEPGGKHSYNFHKIKWTVIREREIEYETFKKHEIPYFRVSRAQRWVEEVPQEEKVKKGWIKRRKIYNQAPVGFSGFAFNMRKWPFNDKNVRLAFCYLFNREQLMEKLFFDEYEYSNSYFPGRDWGNGDENPEMYYDPDVAAEYLRKAGFTKRNAEGYLVDGNGRVLEVTLMYGFQNWERVWLPVKKYYEDAGVKFNLQLIDASTLYKKISERQFLIHFQSWGALLFPNPETSWSSKLADKPYNNNLTGFKNARVDELCAQYNVEFDRAKQKAMTREIDKLVYAEHPYALAWHANFFRIMFWDEFGHPDSYLTRIQQWPHRDIIGYWWWDKRRRLALEAAMDAGRPLKQGRVVRYPWDPEADAEAAGAGKTGD